VSKQTSPDVADEPERGALHDRLADKLRHQIIHGDLKPGMRVSEKSLSEQFGVSRTPVREALKILSVEGLISLAPNRGATVVELTLDDLREVFPVMAALEALAGKLAAERMTDDQIATAARLQDELVAHYRKRDIKGYFRVNEEIHQLIRDAASNAILCNSLRAISGRIRKARFMANLSESRWKAAVDEHARMLKAMKQRDGDKLAELLRQHLHNKLAALEKQFQP